MLFLFIFNAHEHATAYPQKHNHIINHTGMHVGWDCGATLQNHFIK